METENKKSFVLYHDMLEQLEFLDNEQIGELMLAIFRYERYGVEPSDFSDVLKIFFSFVKATLDRDREAYEQRCRKNSQRGKMGGRPRNAEEPVITPKQIAARNAEDWFEQKLQHTFGD